MKQYDAIKSKYNTLFIGAYILLCFVHWNHADLAWEFIGNQNKNHELFGWHGEY